MFLLAILGLAWMASIIMLVKDDNLQAALGSPGAAVFLIGVIGTAVEHVSISFH